jgi:hypothetical protein
MIEQFLGDLGKLDAERVGKLYGQATYWIGFRKNSGDLALRNQEGCLLLKLLSRASEQLSTELLEKFLPAFDVDSGDGAFQLREELREKA